METSPFHKLPGELRDQIYVLALQQTQKIDLFRDQSQIIIDPVLRTERVLALTATCKQIRSECLAIFYSVNHFRVCGGVLRSLYQDCTGVFQQWVDRVGTKQRQALCRLDFELGHCTCAKMRECRSGRAASDYIRPLESHRRTRMASGWTFSLVLAYSSISDPFGLGEALILRFDHVDISNATEEVARAVGDKRSSLKNAAKRGEITESERLTFGRELDVAANFMKDLVAIVGRY